MNKTIAITGANGFIGSALVKALYAKGYEVIAFVHHIPAVQIPGVAYHLYDLSVKPDDAVFKKADVLIHLAFNFKKPIADEVDSNISAAIALKNLALKKYIFISSFSASADTLSYYGKCKYTLESYFQEDITVRPGLVLGKGGLFARMQAQIQKSPFVPLIAGGKQSMQTIYLNDLILAIELLIEKDKKGIFNLAHPLQLTYKQLLQTIAKSIGRKIVFLPVPIWAIRLVIMLTQFMKKPVVTRDNLDGLLTSKYIDTQKDLQILDLIPLSAEVALQKMEE